ncbi:electron transfer flavoprotein subunit alpha [Caproiciproducens sp. NJN-50]|uniref:electron transfer flavoprotein subunit alpha n=1 Tax=Acutalibacteraceae TaxID=3082771 RepID=UPI000FFE080B|nr:MULTISPECIES: electron transfer flavoprotein subunit alpha [Acutalibacteraceae]QAT50268.1 electron transfer flavoprotein subunit alpha [Caproiciproducens sp. NJN-50]
MTAIHFNAAACDLCGQCIEKCPFDALSMEENGPRVNEKCRMCGVCVKVCPSRAIAFEQKPRKDTAGKSRWKGILIYAEQENGELHPVTYELIGEARRLAAKVGYEVSALLVGGDGTEKNAEKLLPYGIKEAFVYEHPGFAGFKADCYADAAADCISQLRPSVVLIGATELGRSLAPRLSVRFHTGLTADCTKLDIRLNTDLVQVRPAFGGNIMAQILIADARPQFATVRYRVMDKAGKVDHPDGKVTPMPVSDAMARSGIEVLEVIPLIRKKSIEEEDILVVAGRGAKNGDGVALVRRLAQTLGGQLCFTRPMVENGFGDTAHQIGLSGRTVRPKLIVTCGVSGAIQFAAGMNGSECVVAINSDPNALIFNIANYCIVDNLFDAVPALLKQLAAAGKEAE